MKHFQFFSCALLATAVLTASPAIARPNLSDITGPNVSDITGPNVSDITGPNVSDITGPDAGSATLTHTEAHQLAHRLGEAYELCASSGDCNLFYELYDRANHAITESGY